MAGIFDTSNVAGSMGTHVTPKEGVAPAPSMGPQLLGLGIQAGMEGATQYQERRVGRGLQEIAQTREEQLQEQKVAAYEGKFQALDLATRQGMPTHQANARARALVAEAKASLPWAAERIQGTYQGFFGGGDKGFEVDPIEAAALAHQRNVADTAAAGGISFRDAEVKLNLDARNERNTAILKSVTLEQENAEGTFRNINADNLNTSSMQVNRMTLQLLGGSTVLSPEAMQSGKTAISIIANQRRMEIRANARDGDNQMKISKTVMDNLMEEVNEWEKAEKGLLQDRDYLTLLTQLESRGDLESSIHARELFYLTHLANKGGGAPLVDAVIKAYQNPEYRAQLIRDNPSFAALIDKDTGQFKKLTAAGMNRLTGMTDPYDLIGASSSSIAQGGGYHASNAILRDPKNTGILETVVQNGVGSTEEQNRIAAVQAVRDAASADYQGASGVLARLPGLKDKFPEAVWKYNIAALEGINQAFITAAFSEGFGMPEDIQVVPSPLAGGSFSLVTSDGSELPSSLKSIVAYQYSNIRHNPGIVDRLEVELGVKLTPADVLEIFINDKIPDRLAERAAKQEGPFDVYTKREQINRYGEAMRPKTPEEMAAVWEENKRQWGVAADATTGFVSSHVNASTFNLPVRTVAALNAWRKRQADKEVPRGTTVPAGSGVLRQPPEKEWEIDSSLIEEFRAATTKAEKMEIARRLGIPQDILNLTPAQKVDMAGIPR